MIKKTFALVAAASLAATPATAASGASALSVQPPAQSEGQGGAYGGSDDGLGGPFAAPGAAIGLTLFGIVVFLGVLLATGVIFDDDDNNQPISA